jgi:hypothetical protein
MLAEALAALASTGGTALVTAMVTDGWEGIRARAARLLGHGSPRDTQAAETRLDQARAELARLSGADLERARAEQAIAWRTRLADLLEQDPGAQTELRQLISDIHATQTTGTVHQHATATGHAQQAVQGHGVQHNTFGGQDGPHRTGQ